MKILRVLSFIGIVLSFVMHIISWTSPNLVHFAVVGIPLQLISMGLTLWLYQKRAMPLQPDANLRWWDRSSSFVHGIIFLAVLSFTFHGAMFVFRVSSFVMFLIRALSSIWIYSYANTYGYAGWAMRYGGREKQSHRGRFQNRAQVTKENIPVPPSVLTHQNVGKRH